MLNEDARRDGKQTENHQKQETKRKLDPKGVDRFVRKSLDLSEDVIQGCMPKGTPHPCIVATVAHPASIFCKIPKKN
jgi:hypothetical protein